MPATRDFALFNTSEQAFGALYGVGLLGVRRDEVGSFLFCHDGASQTSLEFRPDREVALHPAYWKALEVVASDLPEEQALQISDDYNEGSAAAKSLDLRVKQLGQVVSALASVPPGHDGAHAFEQWVQRAFVLLFAGELTNIELKANGMAVNRRDVVATIVAERGFWKRVRDDYGTRQLVIEAKNYDRPTKDDFTQLANYLSNAYGSFGVLICRSDAEGLDNASRNCIKDVYDSHKKLLFVVPTCLLTQCLRKTRSPTKGAKYANEHFSRRLDVFVRSYLALRSR